MRRLAVSLGLFALAVVAGGCTRYVYERAYEEEDYRLRVEDDVRRYVRLVDGELVLRGEQAERLVRLLESRTRHLLDHTRRRDHWRVYPFPRERRPGRVVRGWWRDADRHVANALTPEQADAYYDLVRSGRLSGGDDDHDRPPTR